MKREEKENLEVRASLSETEAKIRREKLAGRVRAGILIGILFYVVSALE
jgi:hypothetical protein